MEVVMNDLTNSREFVEGIVDKIVNDTNLSEVIMKIEPIIKENQELRALIHSQQQMMNEMNTMLLRILNQQNNSSTSPSASPSASEPTEVHVVGDEQSSQVVFHDEGLNCDGLYQPEMTEIVLTPFLQINKENDTTELEELIVEDVQELANHFQESQEVCQLSPPPQQDEPQTVQDQAGQDQAGQDQAVQDQAGQDQAVQDQAVQDQDQVQDSPQEQEDALEQPCIDPKNDEYNDAPHFPEPISLVVSEL
jgi:hypothetical protein